MKATISHNLTEPELIKALAALSDSAEIGDELIKAIKAKTCACDDTPKQPRDKAARHIYNAFVAEFESAIKDIERYTQEISGEFIKSQMAFNFNQAHHAAYDRIDTRTGHIEHIEAKGPVHHNALASSSKQETTTMTIPKNPKTGPQRVAVLRSIAHTIPGMAEYIAKVDAATTKKELNQIDRSKYEQIPNLAGSKIEIGGEELFWVVASLKDIKEREINATEKAALKAAKEAKTADKAKGIRERAEQAKAFVGKNPELAAAIEAHKPSLAETYKGSVDLTLARMIKKYGPDLKGIGNSKDYGILFNMPGVFIKGNNGYQVDANAAIVEANKYADAIAEEWLHKISRKMSEMKQATVKHLNSTEFSITGEVKGHKVHIIQNMIVNYSTYGKPFNQFPARIYVNDKAMSELAYKKMLEDK